jgi:hypothetical protein
MIETTLEPKLFENRFCPACGKDVCANKIDLEIQLLSEKFETLEDLQRELKQNEGILKPEDNSPCFLPQKQPFCDQEGITLFNHIGSPYFIDWSRISTAEGLLMFVLHLTEKCWINRKNIQFLITEASQRYGFGWFKKRDSNEQKLQEKQ